jgi:hypothetical protein
MRKLTTALAALTLLAAGFVLAQAQTPAKTETRVVPFFKAPAEAPRDKNLPTNALQINSELALRVEGMHDGRAMGTLLMKVNGQWVEVMLASKNMRAAVR